MEDVNNLWTISIEEIIDFLQAYVIDKRIAKDEPNKKKSIALKVSSSKLKAIPSKVEEIEFDEFEEDEVEELAIIAKKFKKFLRKK